jgi:DUF4097 and DUF4098 domain-containing protein YvlB
MRYLALAVAVAAVTTLSAPAARAADETEHISRTVALETGGTVRLKSFSGRVTITAADRRDVAIEAVRRGPRDRLDAIKLDIHTEGSNVVVEANHRERSWYEFSGRNNVVETDFDIQVPRHANLDISVFSAPVTVSGVEGAQKIHSFSARLETTGAAGSIEAHSFSGAIAIREPHWQPEQRIDVNTFSGNVELEVPASAQADVVFNSFSGHLNSDLPLTFNSSSRRSVRATLGTRGSGAGELRVKTFSGSLKISQ